MWFDSTRVEPSEPSLSLSYLFLELREAIDFGLGKHAVQVRGHCDQALELLQLVDRSGARDAATMATAAR